MKLGLFIPFSRMGSWLPTVFCALAIAFTSDQVYATDFHSFETLHDFVFDGGFEEEWQLPLVDAHEQGGIESFYPSGCRDEGLFGDEHGTYVFVNDPEFLFTQYGETGSFVFRVSSSEAVMLAIHETMRDQENDTKQVSWHCISAEPGTTFEFSINVRLAQSYRVWVGRPKVDELSEGNLGPGTARLEIFAWN